MPIMPEPGNVFTDNIEFQVDNSARVYGLYIREFKGIGDYRNAQILIFFTLKMVRLMPFRLIEPFSMTRWVNFFGKLN